MPAKFESGEPRIPTWRYVVVVAVTLAVFMLCCMLGQML